VVNKIHWNNCDEQKLNQFINDIKNSNKVSTFVKQKSEEELLKYYQIINENGYLTNLGVLWIGTRYQRSRLLYAPVVQFIKYDEYENKIKKEVWDDFSLNPKEIIKDIWNKIPEWKEGIEISEGILGRHTIYHYNENIIRELLANALVHRPYTTRGDIFINLFHDRLEIHNPGLLPLGVTPQNILHQSVRRNEHLSKIFYDLGLMEREGSGYDKIFEIQASEAKQIPIVQERNDRVTVILHKQIKSIDTIQFVEEIKKQFSLNQKEIICLGIIAQHQSILATEFSKIIQSNDDKQIKNWLGKLPEYKIVKTRGRTKGTEYYIEPKLLKNTTLAITKLKSITTHRLKELIITDITDFGESKFDEIHQRIGKEIPERKVRNALNELFAEGQIRISGSKKFRTYKIY
jgi:ATP-dependent DNA helicase RecG